VKVDRVACPWLIKKFVDPDATFLFVPSAGVMAVAERGNAIPYDVKDVELGHHGKECSFDAVVKKYELDRDPAMVLLAKIVNGAETDNALSNQPEAAGLNAVAEGFRLLGLKDDHEINATEWIVYDALYAYFPCAMSRMTSRFHDITARHRNIPLVPRSAQIPCASSGTTATTIERRRYHFRRR